MAPRPSADQPRLSIIDEDSDALSPSPPSPHSTSHRPFVRRWRDNPPAADYDRSPPTYSVWDVSGPRGEKLMDMRNNKYIVRRGGWKRVYLIFLVIAVVAIALGVGLGIGLGGDGHNDGRSGTPASGSSNTTEPFPIGSYSLSTNLNTVTTDCTANSATWRCYPYIDFNSSPSQSLTTFHWIVQGPLSNLSISSSDNPFAITFSNVSLSLDDAGTDNERYSFSTTLNKLVFPTIPITSDDRNAACWFNGTDFSAALYTKRASANSTFMTNNTNQDVSQDKWVRWPYAVEVNQTIRGGENVPNCYLSKNGALGTKIDTGLSAQSQESLCECAWKNFAL